MSADLDELVTLMAANVAEHVEDIAKRGIDRAVAKEMAKASGISHGYGGLAIDQNSDLHEMIQARGSKLAKELVTEELLLDVEDSFRRKKKKIKKLVRKELEWALEEGINDYIQSLLSEKLEAALDGLVDKALKDLVKRTLEGGADD